MRRMTALRWLSGAAALSVSLSAVPGETSVAKAPTRALSPAEGWLCAESGALGRQHAHESLAARGHACEAILSHQRELLIPLFAAADFSTNVLVQQCLLDGYRQELAVAMTRMMDACAIQLTDGFTAGKVLGTLACRHAPLDVEPPALRIERLQFRASDPNRTDLVTTVVHPVRSERWARQIASTQVDGFLYGCLLGERELLLDIPSPDVDATGQVGWASLGKKVGYAFGRAHCPLPAALKTEILDALTGSGQQAARDEAERGFSAAFSESCALGVMAE